MMALDSLASEARSFQEQGPDIVGVVQFLVLSVSILVGKWHNVVCVEENRPKSSGIPCIGMKGQLLALLEQRI